MVVVTGSRGFIGRHVVRLLARDGDVIGAARSDDPAELLPAEYHDRPFTLVHLAWDTTRSPRYGSHSECVGWLARLLDHWTGRGLRAVVAAGTAEEYGQRPGVLNEDDPPVGRLTAYGWGKAAARTLLQSWADGDRSAVWLRPFVVYGPGQGGNMAVPYAVRQALAGLPAELSDGAQRRDFVHVEDVAEAFRAAVRGRPAGFTTVNVGTGEGTPVRSVLERVGELLGATGRFRFGAIPRRAGEPLLQVASTDRAAAVLGWRAKVHWADGVRDLLESVRRAA